MALSQISMNPDQISEWIRKGISQDFEPMIRKRLQEMVDPIISKMARDIADGISLKVHAIHANHHSDPFGKTMVHLAFNSKDVQYVTESPK